MRGVLCRRYQVPALPFVVVLALGCLFVGLSFAVEQDDSYTAPFWGAVKLWAQPFATTFHVGSPMAVWGGMFIACSILLFIGLVRRNSDGWLMKVTCLVSSCLWMLVFAAGMTSGLRPNASTSGAIVFGLAGLFSFLVGLLIEIDEEID